MQNWMEIENEECNGGLTFILQLWWNEESNSRGLVEESSELASGDTRRRKKSNLLHERFPKLGAPPW
jgi:hypothetical protein